MRVPVILLLLSLAGCGGAGGGAGPGSAPPPPEPPAPVPLELAVGGKAVVKVRVGASGTTVMEERLSPITQPGPDRSLEIFNANGALSGRYSPPAGLALIDFTQHPTGEITVALATSTAVQLVRVSRAAAPIDTTPIVDPQAATDPFYDAGGLRDDHALLPAFTRDAIALAPVGESVVVVLHTGRNSTVAYRYDRAAVGGFAPAWRTLVEPGLSMFGIGITSGSFDTFAALENHFHVHADADEAGNVAVAVASRIGVSPVFAAHADFFSEPIAASHGALVTRLAPDGRRIGATVVDTVRPSELHGLRLAQGEVVLAGRVFTVRRDDGGGWDAWMARVTFASGALAAYRPVDVDRGDILFDIAPLSAGRYLAGGATGYVQNPDGASVSEQASPLVVVLDSNGAVAARASVAEGPRQNGVRTLAAFGNRWVAGGMVNGPGTHSGDGNPSLIAADGFVREIFPPGS